MNEHYLAYYDNTVDVELYFQEIFKLENTRLWFNLRNKKINELKLADERLMALYLMQY